MAKAYKDIISEIDIEFILNLPEVKKAKNDMDRRTEGSVYFSIEISSEIRQKIFENFGLNLTRVPMRWIKGDTKPHIDHGESNFDNTYLVYLTDSEGRFLIDDTSYPIQKNTGYVFSEGLSHETINTGSEPRLLLGPMSEQGFAVGAASIITADGATETIYFNYTEGSGVYYNINGGTNMGVSLPITIINSNTSSSTLKVLFETNITISTSIFYFICGSTNIQFGSTSLNTDGSRAVFTIDDVVNYPGLIQNGTSSSIGFESIHIFNIQVTITNDSTLLQGGGWIGQEYFAKSAFDCYIINCSSDGDISDNSGGIVGSYAGEGQENESYLKIIGCSSSGIIGSNSGGIVGNYAAQNTGNVRCETCWSTGQIGAGSGGIFASNAGDTSGSTTASNCYSEGLINTNGGGIFGTLAGNNSGQATAENCYSRGNISGDAGGIFGEEAKSTSSATNCYSTGTIVTSGNGIYGTDPQTGYTLLNCYSADGTWNTTTADSELLGVPFGSNVVGETWVATIEDEPYELLLMGYTPYTIENIVLFEGSPILNRLIEPNAIYQGSSTESAIISGKSYTIVQIFEGDPDSFSTITINLNSGAISTTLSTTPGQYPLAIRNTGSYNFSVLILNVLENNTPIAQRVNSFAVYNLLLDEVQNSTYLAQTGTYGSYNNSFTIYDVLLLELVNQALVDE
jgi:hypothetical protein